MLETIWMVFSNDTFNSEEMDNESFETLIQNLTKTISEISNIDLRKSAKRALKAVLRAYRLKNKIEGQTLLGSKYDYQTLKDFSVFKNFEKLVENKAMSQDTFSSILKTLNNIQHKRPIQLLKMFSKFPTILDSLVYIATQIYKDKKLEAKDTDVQTELNYVTELLILNYNYSKNKALYQANPTGDASTAMINEEEVKNAGLSVVNMLYDFLFSIAKPYRANLIKSFSKVLFIESLTCAKERQSEFVAKLEYGSNIYESNVPKKPATENIMAIEADNLTEEEIMNLAIQMSLSQQKDTQEKDQGQGTTQFVQPFYRFDITPDLFDHLLNKLNQVKDHVEDSGATFKLVYKILKMQQLISNKLQVPINDSYISAIANTLYNHMQSIDKSAVSNLKDANLQKLLCYFNLANICLLSKESQKPEKKSTKKTKAPEAPQVSEKADLIIPEKSDTEMKTEKTETSNLSKTISLGKEFGIKFTQNLQEKENADQSVSQWLYQFLEALFAHFKSGHGTIYASDNDNVIRRNPPLQKVSKTEVEYLTQVWVPIFKKAEISKREGNLFIELDQDIFISTILFVCSLMTYDFKIADSGKWPELLSKFIFTPVTSQLATSFNKMLIKKIAGSKQASYKVRDYSLFEMEINSINQIYSASDKFKKLLNYDQLVVVTKALSKINGIIQVRPKNWADYCKERNQQIIQVLHELLLLNQNETIEWTFNLLAAYYSPQDKDAAKNKEKSKDIYMEVVLSDRPERVRTTSSWLEITEKYIDQYIDDILLNNYSSNIASATMKMLISLWNVGNNTQKVSIIKHIVNKLPTCTKFGHNTQYLFGLLSHLCKYTEWDSSQNLNQLRDQLVQQIISLLPDIVNKITSHPNFALYSSLHEFLKDKTGTGLKYYLDGEACFRCYEEMNIPYQELRLNDIRTEFKYTSNCVLAKLNNTYSINSIIVTTDERSSYRKFRVIREINVFINNKSGIELVDLKNNWAEWKKIASYTPDKKKDKDERGIFVINLPLPSSAKNIMIEFLMTENLKGMFDGNTMVCPVCFKKFDNRFGSGRCLNCNESILECRKCGYYAEEKFDNLLCSQCGASKFMNYEIMVSAKVGFTAESIDSEKARETVRDCIISSNNLV